MPSPNSADAFAQRAHTGQTREHGAPYISHPRAVALLAADLAQACGLEPSKERNTVALLHDVIEDTGATQADLAAQFGPHVAAAVATLSKAEVASAESRCERDLTYYAQLTASNDDIALIKVADRIHNLLELFLTQDAERARRYLDSTVAHVRPLAASVQSPRVAAGLLAALDVATVASARACNVPLPDGLAAKPNAASNTGTNALPTRTHQGTYVLVNANPNTDLDAALALADAALNAGAPVLQLRAKGLDDDVTLRLALALSEKCRRFCAFFFVNDRSDLALLSGASGVHVGQTDVSVAQARRVMQGQGLVSLSTHDEREFSADAKADWIAMGPIFTSPTKSGHAAEVGLPELAKHAAASKRPLIAIGGITSPARMAAVAAAGADLGAVISVVEKSPDPLLMVCRLQSAFFAALHASMHAGQHAKMNEDSQ